MISGEMKKVVRVFRSRQEAEAADREYCRSLTPAERIDIQLELIQRYREEHGIGERLERVARVVHRPPR